MGGPATALQVGNPVQGTVSRQPQTIQKSMAGAPFVRLSRKATTQGFDLTGLAFGGLVTRGLNAVGGYLTDLILTLKATGGVNGSVTVATAADAPWNTIQTFTLRDALGQPIVTCDGYGLYLINKYSGQVAENGQADPSARASFTAVSVGGAGTGNFTFKVKIPLALDSAAYCAIASLNAAATPQVAIQLAPTGTVFTTAPGTPPVIEVILEQEFWAAPIQDPSLSPPDVGSSAQWQMANSADNIASGAQVRCTIPNVGTWIHTIIAVMRDSTNARIDKFPTGDLTFLLDGVPVRLELFADRVDDMANFTDNITRDTGVIAYTFRDAVKQMISLADTHDLLLPTTPATLLQIGGTFQAVASAPATLTCYTGMVYPVNAARVPYTHLAA